MTRRRGVRTMVGALACSGLLVQTIASAGAAPDDSRAADPGVTQAENCSLRAAHRSEHDEWAHCFRVAASLSRPPAVGQTATLQVAVTADVARPDAEITIELPANLAFASPPAGASLRTGRSSDGLGTATLATTRADFTADSVRHVTATVRATASGPAHVRVRVVAATTWGADAGSDDLFLTVGPTSETSRFGFVTPTTGGVTRATGASVPPSPNRPFKAVPTADLPTPRSDDPPASSPGATSCVDGTWNFFDHTGTLRPSLNYRVEVWDQDTESNDDNLAVLSTDFTGRYYVCFNGSDPDGGGQEVYLRFISNNPLWRVRDTPASNQDYINFTEVVALCDGCNHDFGAIRPLNGIDRGMNAFNAAYAAWAWIPGHCFDTLDSICRQVVINWTATSTDGTYYSLATDDVHLAADDPNSPHTVIHEIGHAVMDDVYEDDYPPRTNCNPHYVQGVSDTGCAWTEGFAEWFPASVLNDPFYRWPTGESLDLENQTWDTFGWANGDAVEGRVAGAMIDISDYTNEGIWDRYGEGVPGNLWTTFVYHVSDTFFQFWGHREQDGYDVANTGARPSLFQNTIDYAFRDPLWDYAEMTRPTPVPHSFSFVATTYRWSAVAIRPPTGADYDLTMYGDYDQNVSLATSYSGGSTIDFVAIDTNHQSYDDYYPRVHQDTGTGSYQIEAAQGQNVLSLGSETVTMSANDVVLVRDSSLGSTERTFFRVVPSNGSQDPELFLMRSDQANPATFVQGRPSAVASSTGGGPGQAEAFSYQAPEIDWYGIVLTNVGGSGTYALHVDRSAPTGSITIDGGAATTRDRTVTLTLAANDGQTGLRDMRVARDGVIDTEPFEPFAASKNITLPAGDGTKTVAVQYRNPAGMSATYTDTITLDTRANLRVTSITNPPASLERGQAFNLTDTTRNMAGSFAGGTRTAYYLLATTIQGETVRTLLGTRQVPGLHDGHKNRGTRSVTVGAAMPPGTYRLLACADNSDVVDEYDEADNCRASANTTVVRVPNLRVTALSDPPASRADGSSFNVTDTVRNAGNGPTGASTSNRYFLSVNLTPGGGDVVLTSNRNVPQLLAGEVDTRTRSVTIPAGTPRGTYHLISCTDRNDVIDESNNNDNCRATAATIRVT